MLIEIVEELEKLNKPDRFVFILEWLKEEGLEPMVHRYSTGKNIILKSDRNRKFGIGSHYDTVPLSPGANDNASAIAVCLGLVDRHFHEPCKEIGLEFFFFDEEESGLIGSTAYLEKYGLDGIRGFLNMELVGMGDRFALWPLAENSRGPALEAFEHAAKTQGIETYRLDKIIMNTADHDSFRKKGLMDSFSITCISKEDIEVAYHYYKAMEFDVDRETLREIFFKAPIMAHYHQPSDLSQYLSEESLQMTLDCMWDAIKTLDQNMAVG